MLRRPVEFAQYCAHDYQKLVKQFGMQPSMSRRGNCYDNAPMESFWGSLKNELVHHQRYATRADAKAAIQEYIESFYNRQRRHSRLGNVPPALFAGKIQQTATGGLKQECPLLTVHLTWPDCRRCCESNKRQNFMQYPCGRAAFLSWISLTRFSVPLHLKPLLHAAPVRAWRACRQF